MTYFVYLLYMAISTAMALIVWFWTLFSINPQTSGLFGIMLFYVSMFLSVLGILALLGLFIRVRLLNTDSMKVYVVRTSFRQAILLSCLMVGSLIMERHGFMSLWSFILLFLFIISSEFFFSASEHA